ncbi:MAG: DUF2585 family protein [Patescibacteria group bacterium]
MISVRLFVLVGVALVAVQGLLLLMFGQPLFCECGYIKVWEGVVLGPGNSQHVSDWYTFSHVIHGFLFYWLIGKFFPQLSFGTRFLFALGIESVWEVVENTPWLIDHYRQQALAQGYVGDSVINSLNDTVAMVVGFFAARRLPVWLSIVAAVLLEAVALYFIRDGLTLNILNFFYQFDFITAWQMGK